MKCNQCKLVEMKVLKQDEQKIYFKCSNCGEESEIKIEDVINIESSQND